MLHTGTTADHEEEKGDAMEDTSLRNDAYESLKEYMQELRGVAKSALRDRPDLLAKLGL